MPTATKQKPAPAPVPAAPQTPLQQLTAALDKYFALADAIHADYLLDGADEIRIARETLWASLEEIELEEEIGLEDVKQFINGAGVKEQQDLLNTFDSELMEWYVTENLDTVDEEDLIDAITGWVLVKPEGLNEQSRLEDFLRGLYPNDNDFDQKVKL